MVHRQQNHVIVVGQPEQLGPEQGAGCQVERRGALPLRQQADRVVARALVQLRQIFDGQGKRGSRAVGRREDRNRLAVRLGEGRP